MKSVLAKQPNGTIQLTISIPWEDYAKTREEVVKATAEKASVPGFRKGKAPKKLVEKQIDEASVQEEVLRKLLPIYYVDAVKEHNINPIMNPKIHVGKLEEGKAWDFTATTCEMPEVVLGDYKDKIKSLTAKSKIIVPGKEETPVKFEEIIQTLLESTTVVIPELIVEQEVDRLLAQMLDEIKKLGLTLDQYLASTNRTPDQVRTEYQKKAESDIKLEFVLQKIAEAEKIVVSDLEVKEAIQKSKSPQERESLEHNSYMLANILRQQKTLDFLRNL